MFSNIKPKKPPFRQLRGYAFDPSLSNKIDTAFINNIIYKVAWEDRLKEGPSGEYLEVIDYDPTVNTFYKPVNLNDPYILAQNGLTPSESNPQFHQQMVYAVAMTTIKNFEDALGRLIIWSQRRLERPKTKPQSKSKRVKEEDDYNIKKAETEYVKTLRIYPHAFRDANAYYSPQKKALLFGYFSSQPAEPTLQMPNSQIFTCLSHDIIAHETTHAILDGIYNNYTEDTNPDVLAFHEAFADIVALFQHFTFPDVLKHQISKTRGDLASQNLLGQLAQEFGSAIGKYGALRDAIGYIDKVTNTWKVKEPNGDEYQTVMEPHARGAILVSAVFEAFISIYKSRVADLLRIATGGSGVLPEGDLHPDLVNRLAGEASKAAGHILKMCIRAIDYCAPVDITFGDYLRAVITADSDLIADDNRDYRLAFIDAFRKRGIYPSGIKSLSVESLRYPETDNGNLDRIFQILTKFLRQFSGEIIYAHADDELSDSREMYKNNSSSLKAGKTTTDSREKIFNLTRDYIVGRYESGKDSIYGLHRRIYEKFDGSEVFQKLTGLAFSHNWSKLGVPTSEAYDSTGPSFWIHSLKLSSRVGPSGNKRNQIILSLTQRAGIEIVTGKLGERKVQTFVPKDGEVRSADKFVMTGGVTLIFDLDSLNLRYAISKPLLDIDSLNKNVPTKINEERALRLHDYYESDDISAYNAYFSEGKHNAAIETFSFLHSH
jgi:hypothetical protein